MQRWKTIMYNVCFALNSLLVFLLIFETRISLPSWLQTVGRMHPLLVHFPIVLMVLCVFWELLSRFKKSFTAEKTDIGDWVLLLASLTAVSSALMGMFLSKEEAYTPDVVAWHKWGGVFLSLLSFLWYAFRHSIRRMTIALAFTSLTGLVMVIVTGHLGADITHGENFLFAPVGADLQTPAVLFEDAEVYADMVQPILKAKCLSCHNEKKAKGELVMEPVNLLIKGGKSGVLWDAAEKDFGLMLRRIHLPIEQKKHMPPVGKPQLTAEEINIISQWIKGGASFTARLYDLPATDSLRLMAAPMFNTIETDVYTFKPADEADIKKLDNNYRLVAPLAIGSPALGITFFSAAQYQDEQLKELLAVKDQIVTLNLNKMPVTDESLKPIGSFANLRKLNLSFTDVTGKGLIALKQLKELKQLSLAGTKVTAAELKFLAALPALTHLYIWNTPAQTQDLVALQRLMKTTKIETGFNGDTIIIKLNPPLVENKEQILLEPVPLRLKHFVNGVSVYFTTDGTEPDSIHATLYKGDIELNKNMTLKAKAFKAGWISSDVVEQTFYKAGIRIDSIRLMQVSTEVPYKTISATVLADAQKGDVNFRSGKWIGFRGIPMQALLYFDTPQNISSVTISNLVDINSYIMPPQLVELWAGNDLQHLRLIKKIIPGQPAMATTAYLKGYELSFDAVKEKYFKVVIVPVAKLPSWHLGKGDKGWIFVDEIFLN